MSDKDDDKARLDKWLWAARFFKTRALAKAAIEGGKVHCRGERCKPAKEPKLGDELTIRAGGTRLQDQQAVVLEDVAEQGHRGEHLAEQLGHRLRVGVLGQHLGVAALEVDQFAAHIGVIEQEALGKIGHARPAKFAGKGRF